jgi:hypothetical protein
MSGDGALGRHPALVCDRLDRMERFSVWADWVLGKAVTEELLLHVNQTWPQDDETFCSGAKRDDPEVLSLTFDVLAEGFDAAATSARAAVQELARTLSLPGKLLPLKAYTETHQFIEE